METVLETISRNKGKTGGMRRGEDTKLSELGKLSEVQEYTLGMSYSPLLGEGKLGEAEPAVSSISSFNNRIPNIPLHT